MVAISYLGSIFSPQEMMGEQFLFRQGLIESWEASWGSLWSPPVLPILGCPQTPKLLLKINAKLVIYWYLALFSNENITFSTSLKESIIIKKTAEESLDVQHDILIFIHRSVQVEIIRGSANHKVILCLCIIWYAWRIAASFLPAFEIILKMWIIHEVKFVNRNTFSVELLLVLKCSLIKR